MENIAEILKYCPKGTKLYSPAYGEVNFIEVTSSLTIKIKLSKLFGDNIKYFFNNGNISIDGECMLFPSYEQRDWKKFRLPVKRGDVMMLTDGTCPFIASGKFAFNKLPAYICGVNTFDNFQISSSVIGFTSSFYIPASEEAKKELFIKMKLAGYEWNPDTLELEKIGPNFREGDVLTRNNTLFLFTGVIINDVLQAYCLRDDGTFMSCGLSPVSVKLASIADRNKLACAMIKGDYWYDRKQHILVGVKQKLKPFDKVLVRNNNSAEWHADIYLGYIEGRISPYRCTRNNYKICIPYEGNEHLLGTTNNPPFDDYIE